MSGFLSNLVAKGRGTVPMLEPRRPAPYEGLPDGPVPDSLEPIPRTSDPLTRPNVPEAAPPSSPTVPAVAADFPEPASVIPASPHRPAPADTTLASNTLSPAPVATAPSAASPPVVPSATPVTAPSVARRMADAAPRTQPPLAPASLPPTQTQNPRPPAKDAPASSGTTERAAPAQFPEAVVLPNAAPLRPVIDVPQTPPATKSQERSLPTSSTRPAPPPPPLLQGEVQIPRPVVQAPVQTPGNAAPPPEAPVVEVHIGTIEVVAAQPPAPMPQPRAAASPGISLDDFLDGTARR
jgi:hypothetical protein